MTRPLAKVGDDRWPTKPPWSYKLWMLTGSRERFFDRLIADYGDFVHYRGPISFYLINRPALVKQVLQGTHDDFDKNSPLYDRFRRAFGQGLVVAEGDAWKRRRSVVQRQMGPTQVRSYFQLMADAADQLTTEWQAAGNATPPLEMAAEMDRLTLEIVGRSLFYEGFDGAQDSIRRWTHTIDDYSSKAPLPIIRSAWFPSKLNRDFRQTLREFHAFIQQMIDRTRRGEGQGGLLAALCSPDPAGDVPLLSDEEIRDEVLGMIIGGHETSSVALTWAWYELSRHPAIEKRLHDEIDTVLGNDPIQLEHLGLLKYTRMVIDETLRLHPPFWFENRNVVRDVELAGVTLRPGDTVAFSRHALHRHPEFWNDPLSFDPQRFEPGAEENSRSSHA